MTGGVYRLDRFTCSFPTRAHSKQQGNLSNLYTTTSDQHKHPDRTGIPMSTAPRLHALTAPIESASTHLTSAGHNLERAAQALDRMSERLDEIGQNLDALDLRLDRIEKNLR